MMLIQLRETHGLYPYLHLVKDIIITIINSHLIIETVLNGMHTIQVNG